VVLRGFGDLKGRKREQKQEIRREKQLNSRKRGKLNSTIERRKKRIVDHLI
jgi:hypothetical protein